MASPIDPVEKRRKGPSPLLFYIMLGIIVGGVLIFLVLSRSHSGGGASKTTATPSSQH